MCSSLFRKLFTLCNAKNLSHILLISLKKIMQDYLSDFNSNIFSYTQKNLYHWWKRNLIPPPPTPQKNKNYFLLNVVGKIWWYIIFEIVYIMTCKNFMQDYLSDFNSNNFSYTQKFHDVWLWSLKLLPDNTTPPKIGDFQYI